MIVRVAQRLEGDHRVEHARKNRRQAVAAFEARHHPFLRLFQGAFAEGMDIAAGKMLGKFVHAIQPDEKIAPGKTLRIARQHQVALMKTVGIKFVQRARCGRNWRVGLKWLMMESGTSMERLHELISLKLT